MTYQNPYLLSYFLSEQAPKEINQQIIKAKSICFQDRTLELAIIGGSHFLHLQHYFFELLTCFPPSFAHDFIYSKNLNIPIEVKHQFHDLHYYFQLTFEEYQESNQFYSFEKKLVEDNHLLFHAFTKESAITAIQLVEQQSHLLKLQTWHTYPESQVVVHTQTTLKI